MSVEVELATAATEKLRAGIAFLLPQLNPNRQRPTLSDLRLFLAAKEKKLLVASVDGAIAGMLSLVALTAIDGQITAHIEDVVVGEEFRRRGAGGLLVDVAIELASELGSTRLLVRTNRNRARADAHRLYQSRGFIKRDDAAVFVREI
jgi:GNAT superfamily N-acetyltransferase